MKEPDLKRATTDAMSLTEEITTKWSSRLVGSQACLDCGDYLHEEFKAFCDETHKDSFSVRPGAFLGYIRINIVLYIVALVALLLEQFLFAMIVANLSVLITVMEFFFYREFVDFLFKKKTGQNVFGTIEPTEEVKQQVIISAHHDSAHIFNLLEKNPLTYDRKVLRATISQFGMIFMVWFLFLSHAFNWMFPPLYWITIGLIGLGAIALKDLWFFYDRKQGTPGAGDNMICTALAMEVGKYFSNNRLKNTRVMVGSWDAEECGLRGARDFVFKYKEELLAIKTYNFNLECMYDHRQMHYLSSDLNGFVELSGEMAEECSQIASNLGYEAKPAKFPLMAGGTDAAEFGKAGIEATTLVAMDWQNRTENTVYHTTRDTVQNVDPEAVRRSIEIAISYIQKSDRNFVSS